MGERIDGSTLDVSEMLTFCEQMPFLTGELQEDDEHANRNNHDEGVWENIRT